MKIYPAIDLKDGKCVRLRQGLAHAVTVYSEDPVAMARQWAGAGGDWLHVVDLDGAFAGHPVHHEVIKAMAAAIAIPLELGGGLRTDADIRQMLEAGVSRVILGTRACADPQALTALVKLFGDRIAVGIDARNGKVQVKGWVETTDTLAVDLAVKVSALGVSTIIYTDTATDGMLTGPNLEGVRALCRAVKANVIASGGISKCDDIAALAALKLPNLDGVIVGKALYEGAVTIPAMKAVAGAVSPS
ncbi:MAG: 1-(5-phosphoribosyl)-5-[(5-phosphoribosylamino)methylideneamino]imidazole-4-carboxamide isomerase [bacterium]